MEEELAQSESFAASAEREDEGPLHAPQPVPPLRHLLLGEEESSAVTDQESNRDESEAEAAQSHSADGSDHLPSPPLSPQAIPAGPLRTASDMVDLVSTAVFDTLLMEMSEELAGDKSIALPSKAVPVPMQDTGALIATIVLGMEKLQGSTVEPVSRESVMDLLHSEGTDIGNPLCSLAIDRMNEESMKVRRNGPPPAWAKFASSSPTARYDPPKNWEMVGRTVASAFKAGEAGIHESPKAPGRGAALSGSTFTWMTQLLSNELANDSDPWENIDAHMLTMQHEIADNIFQDLVDEFAHELQTMD
jgi:hypothetical protein